MQNSKNSQVTKVFALGGLEEVGKNTYCIEHQNEIIIIDAGIKFPGKSLLGVEVIIPDYNYLIQNNKKIKAIFITHGHEDHIGGIPFLLNKINIRKIYAPQLASDLIRLKIKKIKHKTEIIEYDVDSKISTKNFQVSFFQVTHSIPNSFGICVKTPNGVVVTTGDFKLDLTPLRNKTSFHRIAKIGEDKVTLLLSDSTNSELSGHTLTEKKIMENINYLFLSHRKRILITTFASNVDRIYEIIMIAQKINRKIAVLGLAIDRIIEIIKKRKYLNLDPKMFIPREKIKEIPPEQLIVICTGSQGEERSVITQIANRENAYIRGGENDVVIFSSRPIPGNQYKVENLINKLKKNNIQVEISSLWKQLHTSGHANQEEQKMMISLMKPKYFMPIHGEYRMLKIHSETAQSVGVAKENVFICKNGDQILLQKEKAWKEIKSEVPPVYIGRDGKSSDSLKTLSERQIMLRNGTVSCVILIDTIQRKLIKEPELIFKGSFYSPKEKMLIKDIRYQLIKKIEEFFKTNRFDEKKIGEITKNQIATSIYEIKQINPLIVPLILVKK